MNKHFQELAEIVGRAMAKRWMRQANGSAGSPALTKTNDPDKSALPPRRRIRHRQHR